MNMHVKTICVGLALLVCLGGCKKAGDHTGVAYLNPAGATGKPFSEAVRVGNVLFLSGQLGIDPKTGQIVPGGIVDETKQTLENIKATLVKYGSSMENVVKVTVMLSDMREWAVMNSVYLGYFTTHLPARSAFGTTGLAKSARVEIECIAVVNQ